jgi:hypothetical protein
LLGTATAVVHADERLQAWRGERLHRMNRRRTLLAKKMSTQIDCDDGAGQKSTFVSAGS